MMFTRGSLVVLALSLLAIVLPHLGFRTAKKTISQHVHRNICLSVLVVGCFVRLFRLGTLPSGLSAEEALVGVQAKALWQTGGFLFHGGLTAQLTQWTGESTGPLLAVLTAPFVGMLGLSAWSARLPLALLSCAAMPAAYGLGKELGGRSAGRWCMVLYAFCPYFVLAARMTAGANAAVFLLPIALYAAVVGLRRRSALYAGAVVMGLMAYTQNMYFFIAPAAVLLIGCIAVFRGQDKRHAFAATMIGLLICVPAVMTLWVNLSQGEAFRWLGFVEIPALEHFDKANNVAELVEKGEKAFWSATKLWAVIAGGILQLLSHVNINIQMLAPAGMCALYILSIPLVVLGVLSLLRAFLKRRRPAHMPAWVLMVSMFVITLFWLVMFGSIGTLNTTTGCTSVFDYSALFLFDVLLMTAGLCHMERKSEASIAALGWLLIACFVSLCVYVFSGTYQDNANVYFHGFDEAVVEAKQIQQKTGVRINVTASVYPHIAPSDAAEVMYLYAADSDMKEIAERRREAYDIVYAPGIEEPDPEQIYIVTQEDVKAWDLGAFTYREMEQYVLLSPIGQE